MKKNCIKLKIHFKKYKRVLIMKHAISFPFFLFFVPFSPVIFLIIAPSETEAKIEFCLKSDRYQIFSEAELKVFPSSLEQDWYSHEYDDDSGGAQAKGMPGPKITACTTGILFNKPQQLQAVTSDGEPFCYKESICDENWKCNTRKNAIVAEIIQIGKPSKNETWTYTEGDSLQRNCLNCMQFQQQQQQSSPPNLHFESNNHRPKREITGLIPSEHASLDQIQREIDDQTKRMFYYLAGVNQDEVNSHLRVVKLFKMSTQLVSMICDPVYIPSKFLREIERGFLFLLKEQGFDKLVDLDLETYNQLQKQLEHCASIVQLVKFVGSSCPSGIKIEKVYRFEDLGTKRIVNYERSAKTFKWGEYDVVLDGAWSTMSIVHAGCFNSFTGKVNLLHKFEVALEQLFHSALIKRWERPTRLTDDSFYDSMFMARVNDTLEAMDACTRFLYYMTPFGVQMNRPIHETFYRRKKRSVSQEFPSSEESIGKAFSSMENSIEMTRHSSSPASGSSEQEKENDDYGNHYPEFQCLKTDEERINKVKLAQKAEYNDCKNINPESFLLFT